MNARIVAIFSPGNPFSLLLGLSARETPQVHLQRAIHYLRLPIHLQVISITKIEASPIKETTLPKTYL